MEVATFRLGVIGYGHVACALFEMLDKKKEKLAALGFAFKVVCIAVRHTEKERAYPMPEVELVSDIQKLINNSHIDIVIELAGGEEMKKHLLDAIAERKQIITANKLLMALHGAEILTAAQQQRIWVGFEASCLAGIPIIRTLRDQSLTNEIDQITGIFNGTSNYILSEMQQNKVSYHEALISAQEKGFAEENSDSDVEGYDTAYKLVILATLAFNTPMQLDKVSVMGMQFLEAEIELLRTFNCHIKLLASATKNNDNLLLTVKPVVVAETEMPATVNGVQNYLSYHDNDSGQHTVIGEGAGPAPTATAVLQDLLDIAKRPSAEKILIQAAGFDKSNVDYIYLKEEDIEQDFFVSIISNDQKTLKKLIEYFKNSLSKQPAYLTKNELGIFYLFTQTTAQALSNRLMELKKHHGDFYFSLLTVSKTALPVLQSHCQKPNKSNLAKIKLLFSHSKIEVDKKTMPAKSLENS